MPVLLCLFLSMPRKLRALHKMMDLMLESRNQLYLQVFAHLREKLHESIFLLDATVYPNPDSIV